MSMRKERILSLWLCGALVACAAAPSAPSELEAPQLAPPEPRPSQLYARDGTPVGGATSDAGTGIASARPDEGGRMYILELYQRAVEERDALALQVEALSAEGDKLRRALATTEASVAQAEIERGADAAERKRLLAENVELAGRLVTAQIRRLQAEKMLLEHRLAQQLEPASDLQKTPETAGPNAATDPGAGSSAAAANPLPAKPQATPAATEKRQP